MRFRWFLPLVLLLSPDPCRADCLHDCHTDETGRQMIRFFEGYSPFIYHDVGGVATIGFGHALRRGEKVKEPLMMPDAEKLLESDLRGKERAINRMVSRPLHETQFDALADFTFNFGEGRLAKSLLLRCVNLRRDDQVPAQFLRWDRGGGNVLRWLKLRRRAEANLYARAP